MLEFGSIEESAGENWNPGALGEEFRRSEYQNVFRLQVAIEHAPHRPLTDAGAQLEVDVLQRRRLLFESPRVGHRQVRSPQQLRDFGPIGETRKIEPLHE